MRINSISKTDFKGYDARPIKGFIMGVNNGGIAAEMKKIGINEGFEIYSIIQNFRADMSYISTTELPINGRCLFWAQDLWTIINDKLLCKKDNNVTQAVRSFFGLKSDFTQNVARSVKRDVMNNKERISFFDLERAEEFFDEYCTYAGDMDKIGRETHIPGGNVYIIKSDKGNEVIVGDTELSKYSEDEIMGMYNAKKVTVIPQVDYHIDLFTRPLDNKRILIADDELSVIAMENLLVKLEHGEKTPKTKYAINRLETRLKRFMTSIRRNIKPENIEVIDILSSAGYEVIKVPGNVYNYAYNHWCGQETLVYSCNYMNAQVFKNKEGDLVYITNKSCLDKDTGINDSARKDIGCSFEQEFIKSISPYVKPEHIYFVEGKKNYVARRMLGEYLGGIHCATLEVPKE